MAQSKNMAKVSVYMSNGFPLIVFNEKIPGENFFRGVRFNGQKYGQKFARTEVVESSLDELKKQRFPDAQARNVLRAARSAGLGKFAGVPSGCRIVLESSISANKEMQMQISGLADAVNNGKCPFFVKSGLVVQEEGAKNFFIFFPACITDTGKSLMGMEQITALTQCMVKGVPKREGNLFVLGRENSNSSVTIRYPKVPKNVGPSSSLNVINSSPVSGKLDMTVVERQKQRAGIIGKAKRSKGKPENFIDATDPRMSPVDFFACCEIASIAGVALKTNELVLSEIARKFGTELLNLKNSRNYGDFYMMYDSRLRENVSSMTQDLVHKEELSKTRDRVRSRGPSMGLGY